MISGKPPALTKAKNATLFETWPILRVLPTT